MEPTLEQVIEVLNEYLSTELYYEGDGVVYSQLVGTEDAAMAILELFHQSTAINTPA